jgi:multidrug efflux pump subunit AcrA (membrane-fusion protein)
MKTVLLLFGFLFLSGCALLPAEEAPAVVPALVPSQIRAYQTAEVVRGDIQRFTNLVAVNVPAREERLYFSVDGWTVLAVNVSLGDEVTAGDIIAELYRPEIGHQLKSALREEEYILLSLSQLNASHDNYSRERVALESQLHIIHMRLAYLRRQEEMRFVRAGMDGVVTYALHFLYGMGSDTSHPVAIIADIGLHVFRVQGTGARNLHPGKSYPLHLRNESYDALVIDADAFGIVRPETGGADDAFLIITDENPPILSAQDTAMVQVVAEEALNTVIIPLSALRRTSTRTFVYVLENELRIARDVDVGIIGNDIVEIVGGLTIGERVVT